MIYFYSGTPGSGKSLHCARDIYNKLFIKKENVIANFPINEKILAKKKKKGKCSNTFSCQYDRNTDSGGTAGFQNIQQAS